MTKLKKALRKIAKVLLLTYIKLNERKFGNGYQRIKYLFRKGKNKELVVVFSGFPKIGTKGVYNLILTLWNVKMNKLYVLDDFGCCNSGAVYLGENGDFFMIPRVVKLIETIRKKNNIKKLYCVGSSKGGWAALYYGLVCNADLVITGTPQYLYGDYLSQSERSLKILHSIMGDISEKSVNYLNEFLRKEIFNHNGAHKSKVAIHYSKNENTYPEHIIHLLKDLKECKFDVEEDIEYYPDHPQVTNYFPAFCRNRLMKG